MGKSTFLEPYKEMFDTLVEAACRGDLALVHSRLAATGEDVPLLAAVNRPSKDDPEYELVPLALLIKGDPYEMLLPPTRVAEQDEAREAMAPALGTAPFEKYDDPKEGEG